MEVGQEAVGRDAKRGDGAGPSPAHAVAPRAGIRGVIGIEYPRWARAISSIAAIGYGVTVSNAIVVHGLADFPNLWSEVAACVISIIGVIRARRHPSSASAMVLVAVWAELQFGFVISTHPYSVGALATPLLVAGAGLVLGMRWSLGFALSSAVLTPLLVLISPSMGGNATAFDTDLERFYVLHAVVNLGMWAIVSAGMRAFGRSFSQTAASERRLAETIRMAPDGILLVAADGTVAAANPAAECILGVDTAHWIGRPVNDLLEAAGADEEVRAELHTGRPVPVPLAVSLHHEARGTTHVEVTSRVMDEGGEQWMLRDVSERVRSEQARRSMEMQLAHVQRMEAVGQLAGGIAHDFNNLLTAIGASAEMLRVDAVRDDDRVLIDDILSAQERGRTLTRQLLSFARRDLAHARVFDLAAQVRELERLLVRVAGERVRFSFVLGTDCRVRADVGQIEQTLVNLVSNARDAMPEGGACRIAVGRVVGADGTAWVALSVADTGIGMTEATKRHAFEPFFTTKPRGKGTGLGLASVHGIVAASGGRARIDSVPALGTTITLEFPSIDAPVDSPPVPDVAGVAPRLYGSVLVADDDEAIRSAVRRILTRAGYAVTIAVDGLEAARIAEACAAPFDLVLTDVIMPALTGPQLVARLRSRWPAQAAIFMSGYPEDALADVPNFSINRDFLAKPFKPAELERRVAEALAVVTSAA